MPIESLNSLQSTALSTVQEVIRQDNLVRGADIVMSVWTSLHFSSCPVHDGLISPM